MECLCYGFSDSLVCKIAVQPGHITQWKYLGSNPSWWERIGISLLEVFYEILSRFVLIVGIYTVSTG